MSGKRASRRTAAAAYGIAGATATLATISVGLAIADADGDTAFALLMAAEVAAIGAVGGLVAARRPENSCGWLLSSIPFVLAVAVTADRLHRHSGSVPAAWVADWVWIPAIIAGAVFPLLFPTGRPPSPRWRPIVVIAVAGAPLHVAGAALNPGALSEYPSVTNPVGTIAAVEILEAVGFASLVVTLVASLAALAVRFQRSRGAERQQLKWVTTSGVVFLFLFLDPLRLGGGKHFEDALVLTGLLVMAMAVAVAILRYRLYDIDVVINRALVYGALTSALAATYLGSVLLLQVVLSPLTSGSDLAVVVSTLGVAALFGPARRHIQAGVDRRFFRHRYDAARTLEAFGSRLRDGADLATVAAELERAVADTVQPTQVSVWMRR